jgi:plasmid stabilization system protein ParE
MSKVVFSKAARSDRREIIAYTVRRLGVEQARRLRQTFQAKIASLASAPMTGHRREDLDPPGRSFRYVTVMKSFIIVYEPADDGIRVVRLLHGARKLAAELDRDAGQLTQPELNAGRATVRTSSAAFERGKRMDTRHDTPD